MSVAERIGAVDVIDIGFPLTTDTVDQLESLVESIGQPGPVSLVLNLSETPLINSIGLEYLLTLQEQCLRRGGALKLAGPNQLCSDILAVTGIGESVEVFSSVVNAVGSFTE